MDYKTIDTAGQLSAIITSPIKLIDLPNIASSIMGKNLTIEQVGYLSGRRFFMMGGELSINGLVAGSYLIGSSGRINDYEFEIDKDIVSLSLPKSIVLGIDKDIVRLQGITYKVIPFSPTNNVVSPSTKKLLSSLARDSSASGIVYFSGDQIIPLIFVPQTSTYVWENACGSGSLAYSLVTGKYQVRQPSGSIIKIKLLNNTITVTVTAKEI
jgi:hypothetical protein